MSASAMPVSKATNAYELLGEIVALIDEEPRRYDQSDWLAMGEWAHEVYEGHVPECGTVGCVAGWVCALKSTNPSGELEPVFAQEMLGLTSTQRSRLFDGGAAGHRWNEPDGATTPESMRAHADRGIAHIRRFMADHETQLKATRV